MTHAEHANIARTLKARATRLRNKAKAGLALADKIELHRQAKAVDAERQAHMLAFFQLTA